MIYPVAIRKQDQNGLFVAISPDLPDLHITGTSMADVVHNARLIIMSHLQTLAEQNAPITSGTNLNTHLSNPDFLGHTWAIISLNSLKLTPSNYQFVLPAPTLNAIYHHLEIPTRDAINTFILEAIHKQLLAAGVTPPPHLANEP